MITDYVLIGIYGNNDGTAYVIGLEPRTLSQARNALAWQRVAERYPDDYQIAYRIAPDKVRLKDSSVEYVILKGAYTSEAWESFIARYKHQSI